MNTARAFILAIAAILLMAASGFSTITRVTTMGEVGQYVLDDSNIFDYPSMLTRYSNRFLFEYGRGGALPLTQEGGIRSFNGIGGGLFYCVSEHNFFGAFLNANDRTDNNGITIRVADYTFPVTLDDFAGLFYAHDSKSLDFGFEVDAAASRSTVTESLEQRFGDRISRIGLRGGISYDFSNGDLFNLSMGYQRTDFRDEMPSPEGPLLFAESNDNTTIDLAGRFFHKVHQELTLVPVLELVQVNQGVKWDSPDDVDADAELDEVRTDIFSASIGADLTPKENTLVVAAMGIRTQSTKITTQGGTSSESLDYLPFLKAGVESRVTKVFDFRAGLEKQLFTASEGLASRETEETGAAFQAFIGAGFYPRGVVIDVQVDRDFVNRADTGNIRTSVHYLF